MGIEIRNEYGRYVISIDGEFYCTCENLHEVTEELNEIENQGNNQTPG